ncbi:hypothetical protein GGX14DRAFT_558385 [Mycena pura]|uniref:XPG-I domain-containing protein n=1 Tax=Mycena pura TaxID=153505 RepID=A0AAD6YKS2_9AGAR|nr:hypothetical protein GGX14DRAFT_558385 [Mycena pura]
MGSKTFWQTVLKAGKQIDLLHHLLCYYATRSATDPELYIIGVDAFIVLAACAAKAQKVFISAEKIFFFKLCRMLAYPAKFVWIWDGKNKPSEKRGHTVKTETLWGNVQFLVKAFGGVVREAPAEAEAELARLNAAGLIHAVMTHDSDAVLFGAVNIIRWDSTTSPEAILYNAFDIYNETGLSANGLVLFWILCGNDYNTVGLTGCGPKLALQIVNKTQFSDRLVDTFRACSGDGLRLAIDKWANDVCQWLREHGSSSVADRWPLEFPSISLLTNIITPTVSDITPSYRDTFERHICYPPALPTLAVAYRRVFEGAGEGGRSTEDNTLSTFEKEMLKTFRNNVFEPFITHCCYLPYTIYTHPNRIIMPLGNYTLSDRQQRIINKVEDAKNSDLMFPRHQIYFDAGVFVHETFPGKELISSCDRVSAWIPYIFAQRLGLGDKYIHANHTQLAGQAIITHAVTSSLSRTSCVLAALEAAAPNAKAKASVLRKTSSRPSQRARKSSAVAFSRKLSDDRPNQHARKSSPVASSLRSFPNLELPECFASPGKATNPIVIDD